MNIRDVNEELFGKDVFDKVDQVYGLDDEGEVRGSYRPCGYPGVSSMHNTPGVRSLIAWMT